MVSHEDVGIEAKVVTLFVTSEECEIFLEVTCVFEDLLFLVSARDHMVESPFVFYAVFACHAVRIAEPESPVNNSIFKSDPICHHMSHMSLLVFFRGFCGLRDKLRLPL